MTRQSALATPQWCERHFDTPGIVFVETGSRDTEYRNGHIPGAVWIGSQEFQDHLRLGVIGGEKFEKLVGAKGIGNDDTVVLYSGAENMFAAQVYWYFKLYGHASVKLLDGGRSQWERDGRPLVVEVPNRTPTVYLAQKTDRAIRATRDDVLAAIGTKNLIDVRAPEEYRGEIFAPGSAGEAFAPGNNPHEVAQRSGHVPGAVHLEWTEVLNEDGTFKPDAELIRLYSGLDARSSCITYCWVGARSAHTWFVLRELLDWPDVQNYEGSWAEYGSLIGAPVERGAPVS
ncbi:sulfurtransferase [Amycolatopsis pithecellobii]|uniref:Sulfurtransferase n=1 Tax=Amycolatopsis pithecellobii TaxID=664692 RepID=A0A6N7YWI9_9PSEU|nr:sulfurtransferase [Amycolatopsis pithecellobii]MTD57457.1 sulfurtransferase [Amycolatopsis pithecellobii]